MPVTCFHVTDISHDDFGMENQLLEETGRKTVLDPHWTTLTATAQGFHTFLYTSDIEFILIKTDGKIKIRRILPIDPAAELASIKWDTRIDERYHIFKIDPAQKVIITGSPTVRFFRCPRDVSDYGNHASTTPLWKLEKFGRAWEAEDIYEQRDVVADECFPPEHLAEVARRFKAWRAMHTESLFVYLMVPRRLSEGELDLLIESGVRLVADVSWVFVGLPISHAARNADFITSYNPTGYAPGDANYQIHLRVVDAAPIPILIGKTLVRSAPGSSWLDFDGNLPFRSQVQAFLHAGSNTGASDTCPLSSKYNSQSFQTAKPACDIDSFAGGVTQMECRFDVTSG